jgi:hypothetical protein
MSDEQEVVSPVKHDDSDNAEVFPGVIELIPHESVDSRSM